jgi:adenylate cyclase
MLSEAWTSLGFVQLLDWDWKTAESSLRHAIELNPRYAQAHNFLAWLLSTFDKQTAAAESARIAQELDPFSPAANGIAALVAYHARRYDEAIRDSERALERDPTSALSLLCVSMSYAAKGAHREAILRAEHGVNLSPDVNFIRGILGAVYAMGNEREAARGVLSDLLERSNKMYVAPIIISWIYCHLGERDSAFEWLEKAYDQHACTLGFGLRAPLYDAIRDDPRFGQLLNKLRLT